MHTLHKATYLWEKKSNAEQSILIIAFKRPCPATRKARTASFPLQHTFPISACAWCIKIPFFFISFSKFTLEITRKSNTHTQQPHTTRFVFNVYKKNKKKEKLQKNKKSKTATRCSRSWNLNPTKKRFKFLVIKDVITRR